MFHYITLLVALGPICGFPSPLSSPVSVLLRDTGSSTLPYCMYNYNDNTKGAGKCSDAKWGSPNPAYCQQSINFVCLAISQQPASNDSTRGYQTGTGQIDGENAAAPIPFDTCMQAFASLAGCAKSTNENYNADCIGGSINLQFNTNNGHSGQAIKSKLPAYALATPKFFGVDKTSLDFNHPDSQLAADRSNQAAQIAQQQAQEGADANGQKAAGGTAGAKPNAGVPDGGEGIAAARAVVAVGFGVPTDGE